MRYIAERYLKDYDTGKPSAAIGAAQAMGLLSAVLYVLLFQHSDMLVRLAELTRQGDKMFFFVPIAIALIFSLVHGAFTAHFWEALGLKPKSTK